MLYAIKGGIQMSNMGMQDQITTFSRTVVSSKKWTELIEKR